MNCNLKYSDGTNIYFNCSLWLFLRHVIIMISKCLLLQWKANSTRISATKRLRSKTGFHWVTPNNTLTSDGYWHVQKFWHTWNLGPNWYRWRQTPCRLNHCTFGYFLISHLIVPFHYWLSYFSFEYTVSLLLQSLFIKPFNHCRLNRFTLDLTNSPLIEPLHSWLNMQFRFWYDHFTFHLTISPLSKPLHRWLNDFAPFQYIA